MNKEPSTLGSVEPGIDARCDDRLIVSVHFQDGVVDYDGEIQSLSCDCRIGFDVPKSQFAHFVFVSVCLGRKGGWGGSDVSDRCRTR